MPQMQFSGGSVPGSNNVHEYNPSKNFFFKQLAYPANLVKLTAAPETLPENFLSINGTPGEIGSFQSPLRRRSASPHRHTLSASPPCQTHFFAGSNPPIPNIKNTTR